MLHSIFSYLNSDEIICSFLDLNIRFFHLCYPYIERINFSRTINTDLWLTSNFQRIPSFIKTLKLLDIQLDWIFDSPFNLPIYFHQLQTVHLRIILRNEVYKQYIPIFKQYLSKLTLDYQNTSVLSTIDHEILNEFITNDSSSKLSSLGIEGVCLSINNSYFQICQTLKHLTLSVEYQHHLFLLLEYLCELEHLNVGIREGKAGTYDYDYSRTKYFQLKLRELILSGNDIDMLDLNLLVQQCRSTLEIVKLNLKINYIIDGRILESWISNMPLKQLSFYFFCYSIDQTILINNRNDFLSSFQTQPVIFFTNSFYQTCTIISPVYICNKFNCSLTNEFLNYQVNYQFEKLTMSRIKRIFLNDRQQPIYTRKFFQFIKSVFINLEILEIGSSFHLTDDLHLELSTVRTLIIITNEDPLNLKYLLRSLPHLTRLVIDYDLFVSSLNNSYVSLQEILIHFKPNQHIQLNDDFKDQVKLVYGNAKIVS